MIMERKDNASRLWLHLSMVRYAEPRVALLQCNQRQGRECTHCTALDCQLVRPCSQINIRVEQGEERRGDGGVAGCVVCASAIEVTVRTPRAAI
jgi:hypothetical protein